MKNQNTVITIIALLAIMFATWKVADWWYSKKLDDSAETLRREKIKNSELTMINEGLYTKLAADTLTIKQLKKLNDSLELKLENPEVITQVKWKIKYLEKPVDSVSVTDSTVNVVDNYPNKENPFVTYKASINKFTGKGKGSFDFTPQDFFIGIGQNEDGTYSVNTKVPEFVTITGLNVEALPMAEKKVDNFGVIFGVNYGRNFLDKTNLYGVSGGIRYKKIYLDSDVLIGDDSLIGLVGLKLEF